MAKKKKKKIANDRSPSEPLSRSLLKVVFGVFLLLLIVIGTAWLANRYLAPGDGDLRPTTGDAARPEPSEAQHPKITYEIYPAEDKFLGIFLVIVRGHEIIKPMLFQKYLFGVISQRSDSFHFFGIIQSIDLNA